jgi:Uncharacterized conserved protein
MFGQVIGAEIRGFEEREHEGQAARAVIAERIYPTDIDDLWDAITNPERLPRWFLRAHGQFSEGGRYQLEGNAGGTITKCAPPRVLELTWEFGGATSWVLLRLTPEVAEGERDGAATRLVLEHVAPVGVAEEHWESFGPSAVGTGWDLALMGLGHHIASGGAAIDPQEGQAWSLTPEGKAFVRTSTQGWAEAHIAAGADADVARGMAARTAAFYTGESVEESGKKGAD